MLKYLKRLKKGLKKDNQLKIKMLKSVEKVGDWAWGLLKYVWK